MADQITTIPKGWKMTTLGEVLSIKNGKSRPCDGKMYPVYGGNGVLGYSDEYNIDEKIIIVGRVGAYCGSVFLENEKFWLSDNALGVLPKENSNIDFIYYLLIKTNLNKQAIGGAQPLLTQGVINQIEVLAPEDKDEQHAIAAVLSSLDDKIELLREQNKTLETTAQALFKEWFVNFNFPGTTSKSKSRSEQSSTTGMIDSELGRIPEGWRVGKLGDEVKITMGQSPAGESYNENKDGTIFFQGRTDFGERFPKIRLYTSEPKRMAKKFDVLVSVRAPVGDINVASDDCCIGRGLATVSSIYKSYVLYKIKSLKETFDKFETEGTVFGSINKDSFSGIEVLIPEIEIVKAFDEIVVPIDKKVFNNHIQIQTLSTLRDTLLPKLMKGEVRVEGFNN